jgi:hypothetical protein
MNEQNFHACWLDETQTRCFLIPISHEWMDGDFPIRMLDGTERKVDSDALALFELTRADAAEYLQAKISDVLDQICDASTSLLASSSQTVSVTTQQMEGVKSTIRSAAALLNITPILLRQAHDSTQSGLYELLEYIKAGLSQITIDNAEVSEASRSQFDTFQENLQARGIDISKTMENLSVTLPELFAVSDDELVLAEVAAILPDFFQQLERSPANVAELLNQAMQMLLQKLEQPISDEETARIQKGQQQAYEQSAQEAIISSLDVTPLPSLESLMKELCYFEQ